MWLFYEIITFLQPIHVCKRGGTSTNLAQGQLFKKNSKISVFQSGDLLGNSLGLLSVIAKDIEPRKLIEFDPLMDWISEQLNDENVAASALVSFSPVQPIKRVWWSVDLEFEAETLHINHRERPDQFWIRIFRSPITDLDTGVPTWRDRDRAFGSRQVPESGTGWCPNPGRDRDGTVTLKPGPE